MLSLVVALVATSGWQPDGGVQVPLWSARPPGELPIGGAERVVVKERFTLVDRVSTPTMTVYPPKGRNTGAAVVVFPGGGYWILAIDLEGTEACDWLTSRGVTCVLVKYRVAGRGAPRSGCYPESSVALADAQRAIRLTRHRAAELGIDRRKIGVLGFSAGGHLVAATSTLYDRRIYAPKDAIDAESARPDFAIAVYPGHLLEHTDASHPLNRFVPVTSNTPPTLLIHAEDDAVDEVNNAYVYFDALTAAAVRAELHVFARGGHAFGLRATEWPAVAERWLADLSN